MLMNPPIPLCWILYRSWIQKQGDFFVESPIILLRYYLVSQNLNNGKFCTFPCHWIAQQNMLMFSRSLLPTLILKIIYLRLWMLARWHKIQGQIASAKNPCLEWFHLNSIGYDWRWLFRWTSIMDEPKFFVWKQSRQTKYLFCCLGFVQFRIIKLINKKGKLKVRW
jgi:hypothetical protein